MARLSTNRGSKLLSRAVLFGLGANSILVNTPSSTLISLLPQRSQAANSRLSWLDVAVFLAYRNLVHWRSMRFLERLRPLALLFLRCGLALVFIFHGYPKLFGKTAVFISAFERLGLPGYFVYVAGVIEVLGGLMLLLGLYTPLAALLLVLDMGAAMWKYNFNEGIYAVREYELPLVLGLAALALATTGAGPFSLDHLIYRGKK